MSPDPDLQSLADERLASALAETGASDPRASCRQLLRALKEDSESSYREALERFEATVRAIAEEQAHPLDAWLGYARHMAEALDPGTDVSIDPSGRSRPLESDGSWEELILHVPDDPKRRVSLVNVPPDPSGAQAATIDLLVNGKLRLEERSSRPGGSNPT